MDLARKLGRLLVACLVLACGGSDRTTGAIETGYRLIRVEDAEQLEKISGRVPPT